MKRIGCFYKKRLAAISTLSFICFFGLNFSVSADVASTLTKTTKAPSVELVDYFTNTGLSNAVSETQHPAGEYVDGVTYVTYQGLLEDPYIASYHHETKTWFGPYRAGVSDMGKDPSRKIDNHGKPALIIDNNGYIHIVFGGHGGTKELGENKLGNYHYGRQKHVVSKRPYDISEWEQLDNISPFGTYNQWVKMDNGDLYLFFRHGAHRSDWVYQKSIDNGRTFTEPVSILRHTRRDDLDAVDAWYGWFGKAQDDQILLAYTYHLCWDNTEQNKHTGERRNAYYMRMDAKTEQWYNVEGEILNVPVTYEVAEKYTRVFDSGDEWTNHGSVKLDEKGNPHVVYFKGPHLGRKHGGPKYSSYFRWDGKQWLASNDGELPVSTGPIDVYSSLEASLVLASKSKKGAGEVARWFTRDGGETFSKDKVLLSLPKTNFAITSFIRNAHPDAQVMVAAKVSDSPKRKMYLLGENGPVRRLKSEALSQVQN